MSPLPHSDRRAIPWAVAPLLPPVAALGVGIAGSAALAYAYGPWFALAGGVALLLALTLHLRPRPTPLHGRTTGVLLLLSLTGFGGWYAAQRHPLNAGDHITHVYRSGDQLLGRVTAVRPGERRPAVELDLHGILRDTARVAASGRLLLYPTGGDSLRPGQTLLVAAPPRRVPPPLNPGVFDYAAYLAGQGIYHRAYAVANQWAPLPGAPPAALTTLAARARGAWFASLQPYLDGDDLAVAAALIMGKRDLLGAEVRSAYADTGAIHVLAVSGLHVGILALIVVQLLTRLLPAGPGGRAVGTALTLLAVWYFALLTGLSASVQRAALMVSVVLVGKALHRNNGIFNLLAIAALFMLLLDPRQLFQVGFQLSFAAVAGIALFARALRGWLTVPGLPTVVSDAVGVSTAAQLGTLPFSLYYFGQFPVYFLLSGTLVIAFAYVVLGLGLLHGAMAAVGLSGSWLWLTGTLLSWTVWAQNAFILFCQRLPGVTLEFADFGLPSALLLFLLVGGLAYLTYRPSHRARWAVLALAAALGGYWTWYPVLRPEPPQFTIYHLPRGSLIDVYDGHGGTAVGDSIAAGQLDYQVMPARRQLGVDFGTAAAFEADTVTAPATVAYPLLRLLDRRVLVLDGELDYPDAEEWPASDLLLVRNGYRAEALPPQLAGVPIVVDGSNAPYRARDWRAAYPTAHLTAEDGAFRYRER